MQWPRPLNIGVDWHDIWVYGCRRSAPQVRNNDICFLFPIVTAEMRFMRRTADYTGWDQKRNTDVLDELKTMPVLEYIKQ